LISKRFKRAKVRNGVLTSVTLSGSGAAVSFKYDPCERRIAPMSPGLRTIAGCVATPYSDLEHQPSIERFTLHLQDRKKATGVLQKTGMD